MASQSHFVRGSPERSSQSRYVYGPGPIPPQTSVDVARLRAQRSADLYDSAVLGYEKGLPKGHDPRNVNDNVVTPGTSAPSGGTDFYYKDKLRSGFIDYRNSFNEKHKPANLTGYSSDRNRNTENRSRYKVLTNDTRLNRLQGNRRLEGGTKWYPKSLHPPTNGLYRSNSSLELENLDNSDDNLERFQAAIHRDYGSTNSLDVMSNNNNNENSFFAMLQDYRIRNENFDQRAPPPPQINELLMANTARGGGMMAPPGPPPPHKPLAPSHSYNNPGLPRDYSGSSISDASGSRDQTSHSPKLKSKSLKSKDRKRGDRTKSQLGDASNGILKKLRSTKSDPSGESDKNNSASSPDSSETYEERQKFKAFVHYDCRSVGVNVHELSSRTSPLTVEGYMKKNTTTGASAASFTGEETGVEEGDLGDGKSNDLLHSCPYFRNELGGEEEQNLSLNRYTAQKRVQQLLGNTKFEDQVLMKRPACNGICILDNSSNPHGVTEVPIVAYRGLVFEFLDEGAKYYRSYFHGLEHQNFFGIHDTLGPIGVSIKREKVDEKERETSTGKTENNGHCFQYRVIFRTSELETLRGSIIEDAIPTSSRLSSTRGLPPKDILDYIFPDLNLSCLKLATMGPKTQDQLAKLDEQSIARQYKIGVLLQKAGQSTEEDMYNNEHSTPAFKEFLECIGKRVKLKGFDKYRGGLDCKTDSTGTESLFAEFNNFEIMFHVATMLPFTANNKQQLLRKRHIGNDIVTIVFQEPGALPFTPKSVRSQFQHVFIIVRVFNPNTEHVKYSIAVTRSKEVPPFGPPIPAADGAIFHRGQDFAEFLLVKCINAENAVQRSEKFTIMARRTRLEYLKDLAINYVTSTTLDSCSKQSKFSLGSGRKKEKLKTRTIPDLFSRGSLVWKVEVEDFSTAHHMFCYLGISCDYVVLVEIKSRAVVFTCPCKAVIGWTQQPNSIRMYHDQGECIAFRTTPGEGEFADVQEIVNRLTYVTKACQTQEMSLRRNNEGQLGFHVHYEGIVSDVDPAGYAYSAGLRSSCRMVEICKVATSTLTHDQMIDLLRTSAQVKVVVIPPHTDGTPRRYDTKYHQRPIPTYREAVQAQSQLDPGHLESNLHTKQGSYDSMGSRSSGRGSDGHSSEQGSLGRKKENTGTMSSEGFVSGDEREREKYRDKTKEPNDNWAGKVTIYPAYKDPSRNPAASHVSPRSGTSYPSPAAPSESSHQSDHYGSAGYLGNSGNNPLNTSMASSVPSSASGYTPRGQPYPQAPLPPKPSFYLREPMPEVPSSVSNLSLSKSDISSHSSGSYKRERDGYPTREEIDEGRGATGAIPGKGALIGLKGHRKVTRDMSPRSNNSNSPRQKMNTSSEENVYGVRSQSVKAKKSGSKQATSNTFQEDLMRLIDPDVSFNDRENDMDKTSERNRTTGNRNPRYGRSRHPGNTRLQRAQSDESLCGGTSSSKERGAPVPRENFSNDVIFTTAKPAHVVSSRRGDMEADEKKSREDLSKKTASNPALASSNPSIPFPSDAGMDWNNLVDAATKAFEGDTPDSTGVKAKAPQKPRRLHLDDGGSDSSKYIRELEERCERLELQLEQEHLRRTELEDEVTALQDENQRLVEESTTAASQLRKFTEWFFQTIDRS